MRIKQMCIKIRKTTKYVSFQTKSLTFDFYGKFGEIFIHFIENILFPGKLEFLNSLIISSKKKWKKLK
jgi:hypothetical protein